MESLPVPRSRIKRETRAALVDLFPAAFAPKGAEKKPLKIGIDRDIKRACPQFTREALRLALGDYTGGPTYLRHLVIGTPRVGLDGEAEGWVTEDQAIEAKARLATIERNQAKAHRRRIEADRVASLASAAQ